jgi:hypothetical protein
LGKATALRELDLSHTTVDDSVMKAAASAKNLEVLWFTGTKVSDQSVDAVAGLSKLQMVNVQQSAITKTGLSRLKKKRPQLEINE